MSRPTGRDCATCHTKAASGGYVSWAGAAYSHAAGDTNCSNCHNGTTATGLKTPPHVPVTGVQCSNCHVNTATSFEAGYKAMNHTAVAAARCDSCHNGSYTGEGTKGALGSASYSGHVATSGRDCATCHAKAASGGYVSWAGGDLFACGGRHQLLQLPQRHDGDGAEDAAACAGDRRAMFELPREHGDELQPPTR